MVEVYHDKPVKSSKDNQKEFNLNLLPFFPVYIPVVIQPIFYPDLNIFLEIFENIVTWREYEMRILGYFSQTAIIFYARFPPTFFVQYIFQNSGLNLKFNRILLPDYPEVEIREFIIFPARGKTVVYR